MYKLQNALCQKGRRIKINQYQSFSEKQNRMITKYVVTERTSRPIVGEKDEKLLETYQTAEVVKLLAQLYGGG